MLGTFYRAPKPGAPPFVDVGQDITADDTVCIIEVMKLFNAVKAGVSGRIAKICAKDGEMVEYQQTLFLVEEAGKLDEAKRESA
jgi:biotin carboxyl carrier protein